MTMKQPWILALVLCLLAGRAPGAVVSRTIDYDDAEATLEGELFYDDASGAPRPGVVIFHQWSGPSAHERDVARSLAGKGYVAFVADIYGKGIRPATTDARMAEVTKYKSDRPLMRYRAQAAVRTLREQKEVDGRELVAIGFCFGGGVTLELARSGADLLGFVSLHGNLDTPNPADAKNIKGKVLVLHGANDPYVPADQVAAFEKEMRDANVNWELVSYGGAVHAFTVKDAGNDPSQGAAYNEAAATRAWKALDDFLAEVFP